MSSRGIRGPLLEGVEPRHPRAAAVQWYDATVAARLNGAGHPAYLQSFALLGEVEPGSREPPWVFVQRVDFLVGGRWIITRRRAGTASDGLHTKVADAFSRADLRAYALRRWQRSAEPADLAICMLRVVVDTHRLALADLSRRLQDLQQGYVRGRDDPNGSAVLDEAEYRAGLMQVKWVVDSLSRSIIGLARPATDPLTAWFPARDARSPASETAELLQRSEDALSEMREDLRESFALIATTQTSEHLDATHRLQQSNAAADKRARRFETVVQYAAAIFLLPALVSQALGVLPAIYANCPEMRAVVVGGATTGSGVLSVIAVAIYRKRINGGSGPADDGGQRS